MGKLNKILIVESDPSIAKLISEQALSHNKFETKIAQVVDRALELLRSFEPDFILANLDLVGLSGKDLTILEDIQHKIHQAVKIVKSLTAMTESLIPKNLKNTGVDNLIIQVVNRYKSQAKEKRQKIETEFQVSNAICFCRPKSNSISIRRAIIQWN